MCIGKISIEQVPLPILCTDVHGVILTANNVFYRLFQTNNSHLIGLSVNTIIDGIALDNLLNQQQITHGIELQVNIEVTSEKTLACDVKITSSDEHLYWFFQEREIDFFSGNADEITKVQCLLNGINEAYWEWNIKNETIYHSALLMKLLGYDEYEFNAHTSFWEQHVEPKYLKKIYQQNSEHFNGKCSSIDVIFPLKPHKNKMLWVNLVGKISEYQDGKPYKMFGSIKDVTAEHLALIRLKKQNGYIQLAEKMSSSGYWHVDLVNDTLLWSTGVFHIHGVTPKTYAPTLESAIAFYTEDEQPIVQEYLNKAIINQQPFRFKSTILNKKGRRIKVEALAEVELNHEGKSIGIFGVFRDITDAEAALEKLKLMALVHHAIKVPVLFINEQDSIVYQDLLPQKSNENSVLFSYINFSISDYLTFKRQAKESGQFIRNDISFDNYNTVFDVSVTYESDEGIYIWIVNDITEKFRKEQQQIISNRLALLGNTFGNVSHDINNVLGVALGATEMLELKYSLGEKDISSYINRVKNAIDKGKDVTERLLAFTRKPTVNVVEFDPMVEIEKNKYLFKQLLLSTIELTLDIDNIHCEINFPQGEFINILLNLVLNSQDAIREKGLIGKINISAKLTKNNYLAIHVKDSGIGIKSENINKIFDPFYSSKSVNKGNGIGLANVYSTVYKHNGEILVNGYSDLGGAHFILSFKCKVKNLMSKLKNEVDIDKKVNLLGKRVLILDDEVSIAEFIALFLESKNIDAYHVTNKQGLLNILSEDDTYDVFITDMILPDISGREAVEIVKNKFPNISVFSISGYIGEDDDQWHYPVLRKPFNSDELAEFLST